MAGIKITGTGRYLPERVVTNDDFTAFLDTSDEWIFSHTGIKRRRVAEEETTWFMGTQAAKQALEMAGVTPEELDLILVTTVTADYPFPSAACMIQDALGANNAFCFDIAAACAGYVYALDTARRYLCTGDVDKILLVSAEILSSVTNYQDRGTCILLGDGAGACVLEKGDGLFQSWLRSDGSGAKHLYAKRTRQKLPFFDKAPGDSLDPFPADVMDLLYMNGNEVYRFATKAMAEAVRGACDKAGLTPGDLDLIIPHQANIRIIQTAMKNLKLPMDKVYTNIEDYGNTSSASIAICVDECVRLGLLKRGDKACVVGFGGGLVYGACVFEY